VDDVKNRQIIKVLLGVLLFVLVVAGGAWYLQKSLILVKRYDPYTHWAVILFLLPAIAGLLMRLRATPLPGLAALLGALCSAAILFPVYKSLWAVPPSYVDLTIYSVIVFGIGFIATQPIKTTFMIAFRLGRYSLSSVRSNNGNSKPSQSAIKPPKQKLSNTQKLPRHQPNNMIAMMELMIGVCSLVLSIFSVFFMGQT